MGSSSGVVGEVSLMVSAEVELTMRKRVTYEWVELQSAPNRMP